MHIIHQLAMYLHIAVGACALIVFWIPTLARKGSPNHRLYGKLFSWGMYAISFSGLLMSSLDLLFPIAMHAQDIQLSPGQAEDYRYEIRRSALFLFSLSILVLASTRQGWLSIIHKTDRKPLRSKHHIALCASLLLVGCTLLTVGIWTGTIVFIVFSILQIVTAARYFHYNFRAQIRPKEFWIQHLGGLFASGIGAYTAFFVFGGSRLFNILFAELYSQYSAILWVAPGIIGGIAIAVTSKHYQRKFWNKQTATAATQ